MSYNPNLPEFTEVLYLPDHEKIPGYLNISCKYEEQPGWEREGGFTFQYLDRQVFFLAYPALVQLPLGEASTVEEAIEIAKEFLKKWLSMDIKTHSDFQIQLEEEKRREKERRWKEGR